MDSVMEKLRIAALAAMKNAHCPISNFKVGAAVEMSDGSIFAGCNVESVTFNNSTHAEMNAIDTAIASGSRIIKTILVLTDTDSPVFPCALCRQKIAEFGNTARVISMTLDGKSRVTSIEELYPEPFLLKDIGL